jgi:hypothetical protein
VNDNLRNWLYYLKHKLISLKKMPFVPGSVGKRYFCIISIIAMKRSRGQNNNNKITLKKL